MNLGILLDVYFHCIHRDSDWQLRVRLEVQVTNSGSESNSEFPPFHAAGADSGGPGGFVRDGLLSTQMSPNSALDPGPSYFSYILNTRTKLSTTRSGYPGYHVRRGLCIIMGRRPSSFIFVALGACIELKITSPRNGSVLDLTKGRDNGGIDLKILVAIDSGSEYHEKVKGGTIGLFINGTGISFGGLDSVASGSPPGFLMPLTKWQAGRAWLHFELSSFCVDVFFLLIIFVRVTGAKILLQYPYQVCRSWYRLKNGMSIHQEPGQFTHVRSPWCSRK